MSMNIFPVLSRFVLITALLSASPWAAADEQEALVSQSLAHSSPMMHTPPAVAGAGEVIHLRAAVERDWHLQRIWVAVRPAESLGPFTALLDFEQSCESSEGRVEHFGDNTFCVFPMRRSTEGDFAAVVPASLVQPPQLKYFIGSVNKDGKNHLHFGSPAQPKTVLITGESDETELAQKLERHNGHRNAFKLTSEATFYGQRTEGDGRTDTFSDRFGTGRLDYTYRFLSWLYDIRFGVGIERGRVSTQNDSLAAGVPQTNPGLDYGYGAINFEFHRLFSTQLGLVLGASDTGFAAGFDALMRIGPQWSTHLEIGASIIQDLGGRYWLGFHWETVPYVPLTWTLELTERPGVDVEELGVRVMVDADVEINEHFSFGVRLGYATRLSSLSPGFVVGLATNVEF